jgi:hypothetical protein
MISKSIALCMFHRVALSLLTFKTESPKVQLCIESTFYNIGQWLISKQNAMTFL